MTVTFEEVDPRRPDAQALIAALDHDLLERYPGHPTHGIDESTVLGGGGLFVIASAGDCQVGCGALRPLGEGTIEVKRMFVRREWRGRGIARAVLRHLERRAADLGYRTVRLETGRCQPEAIALYASSGYERIPGYGDYASNPMSVCFEKRLDAVWVNRAAAADAVAIAAILAACG